MTTSQPREGPDWTQMVVQHGPALQANARGALGREPRALLGVSADDIADEVFARVMSEGLRYQGTPHQVRRYLQQRARWLLSIGQPHCPHSRPVRDLDAAYRM
jgi:DNA-directed RNA polymerase specialized sigma24 family protein